MPANHIIPISRGLFEHKERLGPAIWEFLWCIDAVTSEELDESGERWGLVHNGVPVKHERIATEMHSSTRTVKRNMATLKQEGYILTIRTARGEIIKVRKNKKDFQHKRSDINGPSQQNEVQIMSHQSDDEVPYLSHHSERSANYVPSDSSDVPDVALLKDFKDLITITTTSTDPYLELLGAYCDLNKRLDVHVKRKEREAMGKMVAGGMPNPFTIRTMELLLEEKRKREGDSFKYPTSFLYYENGIWEAWENCNAVKVPDEPSGGMPKRKITKQQQEIDELDRFIKEEKARGNR